MIDEGKAPMASNGWVRLSGPHPHDHEYQRFKSTGLLPDVGAVSGIDSGLGTLAAHHKNKPTADST
jgi:hypothetical protein